MRVKIAKQISYLTCNIFGIDFDKNFLTPYHCEESLTCTYNITYIVSPSYRVCYNLLFNTKREM